MRLAFRKMGPRKRGYAHTHERLGVLRRLSSAAANSSHWELPVQSVIAPLYYRLGVSGSNSGSAHPGHSCHQPVDKPPTGRLQ